MREIKLRAWDKQNQRIVNFGTPDFWYLSEGGPIGCHNGGGDPDTSIDDYELMQYTGCQDKNGVEIYEGDIISTPFGNYDPTSQSKKAIIGLVEFDLEHQSYQMRLGEKPTGKAAVALNIGPPFTGFFKRRADESEVIGNIYANPDLLKNE